MRKEVPRDSAANKTPRAAVKPTSPGKGQKRAASSAVGKPEVKKKKPVVKPAEGESSKSGSQSPSAEVKKKKLLKPKVVLTKLNPGSVPQLAKTKPVKEAKKETSVKPAKPKPKKVVVNKATKKEIKLENESKRAKIVRAVKDVKKARSVVASKMAKISPKKLSDSGTVRKISGSKINVVKQHNIVKRVKKMSGKKPCVVSVKISNAHSTVTLSVKQNKQIGKKDSLKCSKSSGSKGNERSTISIVKKGIASRRKSTSKECTSQESTPSQSPTRDTSPIRSKDGKSLKLKKSENIKTQKKISKQLSVESKKGSDDKSKEKQGESQLKDSNRDNSDGKTEVIINETVKIKTENVGEDQNMEIEFTTSADKDSNGEKVSKSCENNFGGDIENKSKNDISMQDTKVKSPLIDYNNLKSVDSSTSDEIPLEALKFKQKHIKQEKDSDETSQSSIAPKKSREGKESPRHDAVDNLPLSQRDDDSSNSTTVSDKKRNDTEKQTKTNLAKKISKASLKKMDQESVAKLKISSKTKEKLKDLALRKQKVARLVRNSKLSEEKFRKELSSTDSGKEDNKGRRRMKLLKFWNGPKRHRVASLNAIAKVHCLYENESRGALNDVISSAAALQRAIQESKKLAKKLESSREKEKEREKEKKSILKKPAQSRKKSPEPASTRTLRTNPGVRSVGRNFDILNVISSTSLSSSSSEESSDSGEEKKQLVLPPSVKQKQQQIKKEESEQTTDDESSKKTPPSQDEDSKEGVKKVKKRRRKRNELTMDLKDMVVRKRMASLNASAIMTASYSTEKKSKEERRKEEELKKERKKKKKAKEQPDATPEAEESSGDEDLIVRTTNNKQKVAVIVNQDTDVTITGVYVNSTTRSTHHEGYCSIAGMQYRISSTSHTQTEATAVATETVLHAEHVSNNNIASLLLKLL